MSRFATLETEAERRERQRRQDEALLLLALFLWNEREQRYYTRTGRLVPQRIVRKAVASLVASVDADVADLGRQVAAREIPVDEWRDGVARRLKTAHTAAAAAATGGFRNMSPAAVARLEGTLRFQVTRLERFADDVARGFTTLRSEQVDSETGEVQQVLRIVPMTERRIVARSGMYAAAIMSDSYEGGRRDSHTLAGYRFERNVLHAAEHCDGCLGEDARGWVGIGELVPVGRRDCLTRCFCSLAFARELPD